MDRAPNLPKVPVDVAATGPRVIEVGATLADSVTFAVGADPARIAWAVDHAQLARKQAGLDPSTLKLGAFLNVVVNPDFDRARAMARGTVGVFSHFSGMSRDSTAGMRPEDRAVAQKVGESYDMSRHTRSDAGHAQFIDDSFIDRFAIAGPPAHCVKRFEEILMRITVLGFLFADDPRTWLNSTSLFALFSTAAFAFRV